MVIVVPDRVRAWVNVDVKCCIQPKSEARVGDKKECGELPWLTAFLTRFYIALHGVF